MASDIINQGPPNNLAAEETIIASCFGWGSDEETIAAVVGDLEPEDFYHGETRALFSAVRRIMKRPGTPVDLMTVRDELGDLFGNVVHPEYFYGLCEVSRVTPRPDHYVKVLKDLSRRRKLMRLAYDAIAKAQDLEEDDPIGAHQRAIVNLDIGRTTRGEWKHLAELEQENFLLMEQADAARKSGEATSVVSSGFYDLDHMVTISAGDMVVLAARTGYGKTSLALNWAKNVGKSKPVAIFTLEMSGIAIARRTTATETGISVHRQARGHLEENEWAAVAHMIRERHANEQVYVFDRQNITVEEMKAQCRRLEAKLRQPLGMVVVDYLTLADVEGRPESETVRAAKISRALKLLAGELRCPVLALAQLNRGVDARESKRPELRDLKQSGSIEQDASVVLFIHREGHIDGQKLESGPVDLIIAKNRNGPSGAVTLKFNADRTLFSDYSEYSGGSHEFPYVE